MVDRIKDKEDRRLEALFSSDPLPDLEFSNKVMLRVRRQMWIRRLTMPVALIIGSLIAFKPASELIVTFSKVFTALPSNLTNVSVTLPSLPTDFLPGMTNVILYAAIAFVALLLVPALNE